MLALAPGTGRIVRPLPCDQDFSVELWLELRMTCRVAEGGVRAYWPTRTSSSLTHTTRIPRGAKIRTIQEV